MKSFSIIIPTYNSEKYIETCLNSILNLNYDLNKIQALVIDDGSSDRTKELVKPFLKHSCIEYHLKQNGQWGSVINYVRRNKLAKNDYVSILDADDQLLANCFNIVNNECNNCDLFVGSFWKWNGTKKTKKVHPYWFWFKRELNKRTTMNSPFCLPLTYFVKKEIFYQTHDLLEGVAYQDPDYISQLVYLSKNLRFSRHPVGLYYYNRANNSISQAWSDKRFLAELNACKQCIKNDAPEIVSYRLNLKEFYELCKQKNIIFKIDRKMKFSFFPWYCRIFYSLINFVKYKKLFSIEKK